MYRYKITSIETKLRTYLDFTTVCNFFLIKKKNTSYNFVHVTWVHRKSDDIQLLTVGRQVHSSDQRISLSFRYPNNWRLKIVYITDRDDGVYECQVSTHPPTTMKTYLRVDVPTVRMSVTGTGDVTRGGIDVFYKTGSTLEIVCKVVHAGSNNGSKVSWYRGPQTISTGITERTSNDSSYTTIVSILKIKHVQKTHSGNYTCLVGSPSASAAVNIHILNARFIINTKEILFIYVNWISHNQPQCEY
ncbi:cell adhesion molecule 3-like, partial [Aphis craccivora]